MPMQKKSFSISCPHCLQSFQLEASKPPHFCPLCGGQMKKDLSDQNPPPPKEPWLSNRYQLLENIGKGGMGEVFLAFDTLCGRRIALKKIRTDLLDHPRSDTAS